MAAQLLSRSSYLAILAALGAVGIAPARAEETINYTYDALGRLVQVGHSGSVADGVVATYGFDAAGNRSNVTVTAPVGSAPSFSISDATIGEGGALTFTVTKTGGASGSFSVNYATADSTAVSGSDYTAASGTLTFAAGETTKTITISTVNDTAVENAETMYVNLSAPSGGATISRAQGVGTITDAGPPGAGVSFSIGDAIISEGGVLTFTVTKTGAATGALTLSYATANNTALSGSDYAPASGNLIFSVGETTKTITVSTINNSTFESTETMYLNISAATGGATISRAQGLGTIIDDDPQNGGVNFVIYDPTVGEGGVLTFNVEKTGTAVGSISLNYNTVNISALAGSDYIAKSGVLTFGKDEKLKTIFIQTVDDTIVEPEERMYVNLSNATGGAAISRPQAWGTITDNDAAGNGISFAISDATATEGGDLIFTVTKTGTTLSSYTLKYDIVNGTANPPAVAPLDYYGQAGTLTFGPNDTAKTITVFTTVDQLAETSENLYVNLSAPSGGSVISRSQGEGTILDNGLAPIEKTLNLSAGGPVNLRNLADGSGYQGNSNVIYHFILPAGAVITGNPGGVAPLGGGGAGIDTGAWPSGATLTLVVNGTVRGGGGTGGKGGNGSSRGENAQVGGEAIRCNAPVAITINSGGSLKGGGGGGGGSVSGLPGGGGGGGAPNGAAGAAGGTGAAAGGAGTATRGGTAGQGASASNKGGAGGNYGVAGAAGQGQGSMGGGNGAPAGSAVLYGDLNGCTITNNGSVSGS
ncbi:Calx-beta domain-containing protein [Sphingomonas sp.]|uniref:Calx-beta domain-containing protein n=1 Tax=Sphingomonas sp. TaxID=28214 RepID=UPI003B3BE825